MSVLNIEAMTVSERLDLIGELWDSIPDSVEAMPIPDSHRELLDQRMRAADEDPGAGIPWEDVRSRLRNQQ